MAILTYNEYCNTTLGMVDDVIYNRIAKEFRKILGNKTDKFLQKYYGWTIQKLSAQSAVNIMNCFQII